MKSLWTTIFHKDAEMSKQLKWSGNEGDEGEDSPRENIAGLLDHPLLQQTVRFESHSGSIAIYAQHKL